MPDRTIELLEKGSFSNINDPFRKGNVIVLPRQGSLVIAGDLHGHRRNFERIVTYAQLDRHPDRHLILQEIIHGGSTDPNGGCLSFELLFEAIRLKLNYPNQVHLIMGNHDTSLISGTEVMKDGREMNRAFRDGLAFRFDTYSDTIHERIKQFLLSQPLAIKTKNRIWISHSLPGDRFIDQFDIKIFKYPITDKHCEKPGSVYLLTWGRRMRQETLDHFGSLFGVDWFILGHQTQEQGYARYGQNLLIIISEHNHGCMAHVSLEEDLTMETIMDSIIPLSSIA